MPREQSEKLIHAYFDAFNRGDRDGMIGLLDANIRHDVNEGDSRIGTAKFRAFMQHMDRCYRERLSGIVVMSNSDGSRASASFIVHGEYIATDAGLPEGVLGLVYGNPAEISEYLIPHPVIRKITFTGSTQVGKQLTSLAGLHMKRVTMELGGHAPVIVCEDADIGLAVKAAGAAKFRNAGQVCISPTRFLVHESVKQEFAQAMAAYAKGLKVGDGLEDGVQMGPLANPRRVTAMEALHADAVSKGATVLAGGKRMGQVGNFWEPTVLLDVPLDAKVYNDEPFGPVAGIRGFTQLEDAIEEANRLSYGLAGYAFTRSLRNADLLTRRVEVGMLWINMPAMPSAEMPFGGIKDSGYGSEGGPEALEAYLNVRSVAVLNA